MKLDESRAHRAWSKFDEEVSDVLLRAVSGAFVVVACADGELVDAEIAMFLDLVNDTHAFASVDRTALERHFRSLARATLDDFEAGQRRALEAVAQVKGHDRHTALVVSAAQIAIVSDQRLQDREEQALRQICEVLGLDPAAY